MEKFTRTYSVIHLDSINYNISQVKKQLKPDTKILAIVKANAYGHGALRIATEIKDEVYGFGVATVREALELRHNGIKNFILVLGYVSAAEYEDMIDNKGKNKVTIYYSSTGSLFILYYNYTDSKYYIGEIKK